jgi:hypothetical protein
MGNQRTSGSRLLRARATTSRAVDANDSFWHFADFEFASTHPLKIGHLVTGRPYRILTQADVPLAKFSSTTDVTLASIHARPARRPGRRTQAPRENSRSGGRSMTVPSAAASSRAVRLRPGKAYRPSLQVPSLSPGSRNHDRTARTLGGADRTTLGWADVDLSIKRYAAGCWRSERILC